MIDKLSLIRAILDCKNEAILSTIAGTLSEATIAGTLSEATRSLEGFRRSRSCRRKKAGSHRPVTDGR
jgi:hypothetical protein